MACGACAARRQRFLRAAKARSIRGVLSEAAKGAAEMTGLKRKTALDETAEEVMSSRRAFRLPKGKR